MDDFRQSPRPVINPQATPATPRRAILAQVPGIGGPAPANQAAQLLQGLSSLNGALGQYADGENREAARQAALMDAQAQRDAKVSGAASGATSTAPVEALTGVPVDLPPSVPLAYGREFRDSWSETVGERAGATIKADAMEQYSKLRDTADFDSRGWLADQRQEALRGVTDPRMVVSVNAHLRELEATVQADQGRQLRQVRDQERATTMAVVAADMFPASAKGDELAKAYPLFVSRVREIGFTPREAASAVFTQLQHQSNLLGGAPELFDLFEQKNDLGMRIIDANPDLVPHIDQARRSAQQARDKATMEGAEKGNARTLDGIEKDIDTNPFAVTEDRLMSQYTKFGAIQTPGQYAAIMDRAREAQLKMAGAEANDSLAGQGLLWSLKPEAQQQVLERKLGPGMDALSQALQAGNTEAVAGIAGQLVTLQSRSGSTVKLDRLGRFIDSYVTTIPNADGPTPGFRAVAELYRAMSGTPQMVDRYFAEPMQRVMSAYVDGLKAGADPVAAHKQAFRSETPEAKAAAEEMVKSPEFRKMVEKDAESAVVGSSWFPRFLGGAGRAENQETVRVALAHELRQWRNRTPFASSADAEKFAERWTASNFAMDRTTGMAVKIPPSPAIPPQAAADALSTYSAELTEKHGLKKMSDADWSVRYIMTDKEGAYTAVAYANGIPGKVLGSFNLGALVRQESEKKLLTDTDKAALASWKDARIKGLPGELDPKVLAKAEALGVISSKDSQAYRQGQREGLIKRLQQVPSLGFPEVPLTDLRGRTMEHKLTGLTALQFADSTTGPYQQQGGHMGLAASLVTLGEGVRLVAYGDPAQKAGKNIGVGYNLKANAATANDDLRRAGVPVDVIPQVLEGKAQLSPEQAKRLLMVTLPRYEKMVKETAEAQSPGLFDRMLPAQRAAMLDVAYQVGSTDQFRKAWSALAAGKSDEFASAIRVTYEKSPGVRVEDTRRNALRSKLLAGLWDSVLQQYGQLPSDKLESAALVAKTKG